VVTKLCSETNEIEEATLWSPKVGLERFDKNNSRAVCFMGDKHTYSHTPISCRHAPSKSHVQPFSASMEVFTVPIGHFPTIHILFIRETSP
jgi:hypothetical protein